MDYTLCVPCLLGLEAPIADELKRLELNGVRSENGRVYFDGDERSIVRANINLRCGERILVELGSFEARTFEELFQGTKALPWERIIPKDAAFPVKGYSLNSEMLFFLNPDIAENFWIVQSRKFVFSIGRHDFYK